MRITFDWAPAQAMVFGVAMNSKKNTLVALLIAANFTEIKGVVGPCEALRRPTQQPVSPASQPATECSAKPTRPSSTHPPLHRAAPCVQAQS